MTITLKNVTERYSLKTALDSISVEFGSGRIHAIVGENGAGKSTLASILSGDRRPTSGTILLDGKQVTFRTPRQAASYGIIQVHQRPLLAGSISVKENILLGTEHTIDRETGKPVPRRVIQARLTVYTRQWISDIDMNAPVYSITSDKRFFTALLGALCRNPAVLILDEPSATLNWEQRRVLYANLRSLAQRGLNVLIITHSMKEAELYTDTVTVLEKGRIIAYYPRSRDFTAGSKGYIHFTEPALNQKLPRERPEESPGGFIAFSHTTVRPADRPALFDISFTAHTGAMTLIRGMQESGLMTLENLITGMETERSSGTFTLSYSPGGIAKTETLVRKLAYQPLTPALLRNGTSAGTAIIPSDRTFRGSNPALTVMQLLTVQYTGTKPEKYAQQLIRKAGISIAAHELVSNLSGGMLQRLILARELETEPVFLILCEPLQGLDSVSASALCEQLYKLARKGKSIVVLSAAGFPDQFCDSIYTLSDGKLEQTGGTV